MVLWQSPVNVLIILPYFFANFMMLRHATPEVATVTGAKELCSIWRSIFLMALATIHGLVADSTKLLEAKESTHDVSKTGHLPAWNRMIVVSSHFLCQH